ncbi:MAG: YraN family protein [Minisyncoccia bacterium]
MKRFTSKTQKIGEIGEQICLEHLKKQQFEIIETNYTKKSGEIDIIAKKKNKLHFIEVKSGILHKDVSYETYNPAENLSKTKLSKIQKTVLIYLQEKDVSYETRWQIDLYIVFIDKRLGQHSIECIENIVS